MSKTKTIRELTNILAIALRHKIGSIVNQNEIYAQKYAKDSEVLLKQAEKISHSENLNSQDKAIIKDELKKKLHSELEKKPFLDKKKFDIMEDEISKALKMLDLS